MRYVYGTALIIRASHIADAKGDTKNRSATTTTTTAIEMLRYVGEYYSEELVHCTRDNNIRHRQGTITAKNDTKGKSQGEFVGGGVRYEIRKVCCTQGGENKVNERIVDPVRRRVT